MAESTNPYTGFVLDLAQIYGGIKTAEANAEFAAMQSQFEALKLQQSALAYDAQSLNQPLTAGVGAASGGAGSLLLLALVGVSVYLIAKE